MAEHPRQEIELSFGGKTYRVRPTFEVVVGIEAELNQSSRVVGMKLLRAEASLAEITVILWNALKGKKGAPDTRQEVGEVIMEDGYRDLLVPLGNFLLRAQRGNKEHEKEAAEAEAAAKGKEAADGATADPPLAKVSSIARGG